MTRLASSKRERESDQTGGDATPEKLKTAARESESRYRVRLVRRELGFMCFSQESGRRRENACVD